MTKNDQLVNALHSQFGDALIHDAYQEVTLSCEVNQMLPVLTQLRNDEQFAFDQLIDVCGVDYLCYGESDWETDQASFQGFSRAASRQSITSLQNRPRFCVVYHLLSITHNYRLRVKVALHEESLVIPSVHILWRSANWFEREAYDLYGILFDGHPDLRRILTDYGFIGHPFRKDFPLSGYVEMRYDAAQQKVIYEPVDIQPRVTVPRVVRDDNRYLDKKEVCRD